MFTKFLTEQIASAISGGLLGAAFSAIRNKKSAILTVFYAIFGGFICAAGVDYVGMTSPIQAFGLGVIFGIVSPAFIDRLYSDSDDISGKVINKLPIIGKKDLKDE